MLYNITITTHMSIPLDVVERLSHHPNIVGLKDSENNIPRLEEALELFSEHDDFSYFSGCAANSAIALKNEVPTALCQAWATTGLKPTDVCMRLA